MHRVRKGTTWNTIDVPFIGEFTKKVVKAGARAVQKKTTVPGVGYMVYCADTEGNIFGTMRSDEKAN